MRPDPVNNDQERGAILGGLIAGVGALVADLQPAEHAEVARAVFDDPVLPVEAAEASQTFEKPLVQFRPDPGIDPLVKPPRIGGSRDAESLARKHLSL